MARSTSAWVVAALDVCGLTHNAGWREDRGDLVLGDAEATGGPGPQGAPAWPWTWMGDAADFAALEALGLGTGDARKA